MQTDIRSIPEQLLSKKKCNLLKVHDMSTVPNHNGSHVEVVYSPTRTLNDPELRQRE